MEQAFAAPMPITVNFVQEHSALFQTLNNCDTAAAAKYQGCFIKYFASEDLQRIALEEFDLSQLCWTALNNCEAAEVEAVAVVVSKSVAIVAAVVEVVEVLLEAAPVQVVVLEALD